MALDPISAGARLEMILDPGTMREMNEDLIAGDPIAFPGYMDKLTAQRQKTGILNALGVAPKRTDGDFVNVKIGVDGYNSIKTKKYKKGQPNAMIVRALESGTSFRTRSPFITKAVRKARRETEKAMADAYDTAMKRRFKEAL